MRWPYKPGTPITEELKYQAGLWGKPNGVIVFETIDGKLCAFQILEDDSKELIDPRDIEWINIP